MKELVLTLLGNAFISGSTTSNPCITAWAEDENGRGYDVYWDILPEYLDKLDTVNLPAENLCNFDCPCLVIDDEGNHIIGDVVIKPEEWDSDNI
jgi:hypothetical protein